VLLHLEKNTCILRMLPTVEDVLLVDCVVHYFFFFTSRVNIQGIEMLSLGSFKTGAILLVSRQCL